VISSLGILGGFVSPTLIGWIKGATGSIQMGLGAPTALVIVGGLTMLIALPKSAVRVGTADDAASRSPSTRPKLLPRVARSRRRPGHT
jgi:nitrate/nitrite transporter NarK